MIQRIAFVLSFIPGAIPIMAFLVLSLYNLRQGIAYFFPFSLDMIIVGVLLLFVAVITQRDAFLGGVLFTGFGALALLFMSGQLMSELDPFMYLVFILPFCLFIILAGILNIKVGIEEERSVSKKDR